MATVFIIHGAYGCPAENWIPWLAAELKKAGHSVIVPTFPTPEGQSLNSWLEEINHFSVADSVMVGHSIGCAFILRLAERCRIKSAIFVSPFISLLGNPKFDEINSSFVDKPFDWKKIRANCSEFTIFHSDNDPFVPLAEAVKVADGLGIKVTVIKGGGHFNAAAGFTQFQELLKKIITNQW